MEDDKSVIEDCQSVWGIGNSQGCPLLHASNDVHTLSKLACFFLQRVSWLILDCARRTSTFISCAFREQEDDQATLPILRRPRVARAHSPNLSMALPSSLTFLSWKDTHVGLSAAVERGPSEGARSGSREPTWVSFLPASAELIPCIALFDRPEHRFFEFPQRHVVRKIASTGSFK